MMLGGNPEENNVYGYFSWNDNGDGIIALRNPTDEKAPLTLTLNKLMGCPETLKNVNRFNVYNEGASENFESYSYGDKIDLTLKPFEIKVLQFGKSDRRYDYLEATDEFTVSFKYNSDDENCSICENGDVKIAIEDGYVNIRCDSIVLNSSCKVTGAEHKIIVVREKNKMVKLYIDKNLDGSGYDANAKGEIDTKLEGDALEFSAINKATSYEDIIALKRVLTKAVKRRKK